MPVRNEDDGCQSVEEAVRGCVLSTRSCTTITNVGAIFIAETDQQHNRRRA